MSRARRASAVMAAFAAVAFIATTLPLAQSGGPTPAATGLIVGRVVDGTTERPVAGVIVTLIGSGPAQPPRVITDSAGRFLFHGLAPARYMFDVTGTSALLGGGYGVRRPGGAPQPFDLKEGERATDVTLRVWKCASVSGTLTDPFDDPVPETKVSAMRIDVIAGRRRYKSAGTAMTDDRGVYRISRLEPGSYIIYLPFTQTTIPTTSTVPPDLGGLGFRIGDLILVRESTSYALGAPIGPMVKSPAPSADGRLLVYPFQFYPAASRPADATVLTLESGQDRVGTDLQVRSVTSARISGRLMGPDGPLTAITVRLVPQSAGDAADEEAFDAARTVSDSSGNFTFLGVPAGQYAIKAARVPVPPRPPRPSVETMGPNGGLVTAAAAPQAGPVLLPDAPTLGATMPVVLGDVDVAGIELMLQSGSRVSGRIEYDGTLTPLTSDQLQRLTISFDPIDGRSFTASSGKGQFDAGGRFKSAGLLPGRYLMRVGGNLVGWTFVSALAGGRDVSDEPLVVDREEIGGVVIRFSDRPSGLSGSVRDANGAPDKNAAVLLFPSDRAKWVDSGSSPRRELSVRASVKGAYDITNLPPGDYFVVAVDDQSSAGWQDPKRLEALSRLATRVTIRGGEKRPADLVTARVQ